MADMLTTLRFVRDGGQTLRYHTVSRTEPERVGQHSFGVAWLCYLLSGGAPSSLLLMAALAHDVAEWALGDIPAPTKIKLGIKAQVDEQEAQCMARAGIEVLGLSGDETYILKLADAMDGMLSCARERALGNKLITACYTSFRGYTTLLLGERCETLRTKTLFSAIEDIWEEANQ